MKQLNTKFVLILPPRKVRVPPDKKLGLVIRNNQPACRVGDGEIGHGTSLEDVNIFQPLKTN